MPPPALPLSVLDLALVGTGQSSADALEATTALAGRADELGYLRFWVAEHHCMPAVASTSPAVLIAHLASATSRIRVGSGGVMLPNHPPLVVAEQFAMLEALHPGRVDLGIGRAPGTDPRTAAALRRSPDALGAEDFPQHLLELLILLGHPAAELEEAGPAARAPGSLTDHRAARFSATPAPVSSPAVLLLGSSGFSAQLAGVLGLPFAFAHHFSGHGTAEAIGAYRDTFRSSAALAQPHAIVTASVVAAESEDEAHHLAGPYRLMVLGLRTGRLGPLHTPEEAAAHPHREAAESLWTPQISGSVDSVVDRLADLATSVAADEVMVTAPLHGITDRIRTLELLAGAWAPDPAPASAGAGRA